MTIETVDSVALTDVLFNMEKLHFLLKGREGPRVQLKDLDFLSLSMLEK